MKKPWIIAGCGLVMLVCLVLLVSRRSSEHIVSDRDMGGSVVEYSQELPAELNTGLMAVKNMCGKYGIELLGHIVAKDETALYEKMNHKVLNRYGYVCNQEVLNQFWRSLADLFPDAAQISVFDLVPSGISQGGFTVTYYIAGPAENSTDTETYDCSGSLWLTIMVYFNENGEISSMLPCPEASIESYALSLGFIKESDTDSIIKINE